VFEGAAAQLALARAVCDLGLIPGELTGMLPSGTQFPMGEGLVCVTDPADRSPTCSHRNHMLPIRCIHEPCRNIEAMLADAIEGLV
jgi:hypothetical protein